MKHLYKISADKIFGANIAGFIRSEKGVGSAVRSAAECFRQAGIPFVLNNFTDKNSLNSVAEFNGFSRNNPYLFNLICVGLDTFENFIKEKTKPYFNGHYNIAYWNWELSEFPLFCHLFDYIDEIWVPSNFALNAVSFVSPVPVVRMPYGIGSGSSVGSGDNGGQEGQGGREARGGQNGKKIRRMRRDFGLSEGDYIFLFIFDFQSIAERKNPFGLIKAFKEAFGAKDDAFLIIKCSHSDADPSNFAEIKRLSEKHRIKIIDSVLTAGEISSLLDAADCYASLHRSEGFGLTIAEAMSKGKPVIATGYSGNMDFMTPSNSYPVKYNLAGLDRDYGPYERENVWADPDAGDAARLMRYVYEHREEASHTGSAAAADIKKNLNYSAIGGLINNRLETVINSLRLKKLIKAGNSGGGYIFDKKKAVYNDDKILLNDIYNSYEWKLIVAYHKITNYLLPRGSIIRRALKSVFKGLEKGVRLIFRKR